MSEAIEEQELTAEELYEKEYNEAYFEDESDSNEEVSVEEKEEVVETEEPTAEEVSDEVSEDKEDVETTEEEVEAKEEEEQPEKDSKRTLKWNKQEVEVSEEERDAMAQQAFDYTYKTQQLAKEKKAFESELDLLNKAKAGDKQALASLMKNADVDPLDLMDVDIEQGTDKPTEPFISPQVSALMTEVEKDPELYTALQGLERELPDSVVNTMAQDPETFYTVVNEVKSGDIGVVMPRLNATIATLSDMDRSVVMNDPRAYANLYMNVKQSLMQQSQPQETSTPEKPVAKKTKPNYNEVSVQSSGKTTKVDDSQVNSLTSDDAYQAILDRLNTQR